MRSARTLLVTPTAVREVEAGHAEAAGGRLVAVWAVVGDGVRFVVRSGEGPWPRPGRDADAPERWAREDAARFSGRVRYRVATRDPWLTLEEGFFLPGQLA
ncbi:hypothetical protein [Oceanithermus sp.]